MSIVMALPTLGKGILAVLATHCAIVPMLVLQRVMLLEILRCLPSLPQPSACFCKYDAVWRHPATRLPPEKRCACIPAPGHSCHSEREAAADTLYDYYD